jgi:hypothetical protein
MPTQSTAICTVFEKIASGQSSTNRYPEMLASTREYLERSAHDISTERESDAASRLDPAVPATLAQDCQKQVAAFNCGNDRSL